jgi:transposase
MSDQVKTVMVGDRRFRLPFLDLIPFDDDQNATLGEAIREAGKVKVPVACWKEKKSSSEDTVVDGAHRVLWAAQLMLDKVPVRYESYDSEEEAKAECEEINLHRRHLSQRQLELARRLRIERVAELKRQGQSNRAIADEVGVSESTVRNDLERAVAQGCATEPPRGQITTRDGKKRSAKAARCKRCKRLGAPVRGCQQCDRARKAKAKKQAAQKEARAEAVAPLDAFKNPVPPHRRDALLDPWIQDAIDFLAETSESFRMKRLMEQMSKKAKHYPFFIPKDFIDGCGFVIQYLDQLIEHLKDNRPAAVCPACEGKGCGACRMAGLVPRNLYPRLKGSK